MAGALLTFGIGVPSAGADPNRSDMRFMREAARGGMAEVKLGQLALDRGASERVRHFGQRMIDDHSKANDRLKDIASRERVDLPTDIGAKNQALYDRLSSLHGAAFDAAYIRNMKMDHAEDIAAFRSEKNGGHDRAVRRFASETLPIVQEHYNMISDMSRNRRMRMNRM